MDPNQAVGALHDIVLSGGRVLDPETNLDLVANVGITGDRITAVSTQPLQGRREIDVTSYAVSPGFIDLHSHSHTLVGHRLQCCDGVTTVLELEAGVSPPAEAYDEAARDGRPLNYGFSASWMQARMGIVAGMARTGGFAAELECIGRPEWQRDATPRQVEQIMATVARDVADGALGVGITIGYAPSIDPAEYLGVARVAAAAGVPTFSHVRDLIDYAPDQVIDGAEELVRAAGETGAHMHYCHINSTSLRHIDRVHDLVEGIRREGSRVTTEAYPYGAGMTGIGAAFLRPERLPNRGWHAQLIVYARTGETVANDERLRVLQAEDPGGLAIMHYFDENVPEERAFIDRSMLFPDTAVASDAVPLTWPDGRARPADWPPSSDSVTHPRTAGCFSKVLREYVRERGAMTLLEAVRRSSYLPALVLAESVPAMRTKGRLQPGCDADVIVFDPATVSDRATYERSTLPSTGYRFVFVNGQAVIFEGVLDVEAFPGRAVRR